MRALTFAVVALFAAASAATNATINSVQWTMSEFGRLNIPAIPKNFATFKPPKDDPKKPVDDSKRRPNERMGLAWQAYQNGEYEKALLQLKKILSDAPKSPEAVSAEMLTGYSLVALGQGSQAGPSFERVTNQFKFHPLAKPATYAVLALAVNSGKYDDAIKAFPKLGQPKNDLTPLTIYGLGVAYRGAKNDTAAISNFDLFRKQYSNAVEIPHLYFHLALIFRAQGNFAAAKSNLSLLLNGFIDAPTRLIAEQELIGIANQEKDKAAFIAATLQLIKEFGSSPRIDENRFALAKSYYDDGKKSDAAANFEPLLVAPYLKSPRRPEALVYLARMAVDSGDRAQIRKWGLQLVKEQPTHSLSIQLLPDLLRFAYLDKDFSGAASMAETIKQNTSLDIEIRRDAIKYLILIYDLKAPDSQKALTAYQDFFRLNPPEGFEKLSTLRDYNKLLEKMGRKDILKETVQTVYEATRQPSDKSTNAFQLAQLYESSDKAKALQFYELAVSLQPDSKNAIPALQTAARLGVELGQSAKADFIVAKIIRNYPDKEPAPASYLLLAQAHEKAGNKSEAVKNYKRVAEGFPASSEARTASDALKKLQ